MQVVAPCYYADTSGFAHYLVESCRQHDVPLHLYGVGETYINWMDTHVTALRRVLQSTDDELVLFTDASDVIFLSGTDEILRKYEKHFAPSLVLSIEHDGGLNAGGWMGRRRHALECLDIIESCGDSGDPQQRWRQALRQDRLSNVRLDTQSRIFQVNDWGPLVMRGDRLKNLFTDQQPCILHFAGGYTDHVTGKRRQMEPTWKILGY